MPYYFFFIGLVGNTLCDEAVNVKRRSKIFFLSLNFPFSFFRFLPSFRKYFREFTTPAVPCVPVLLTRPCRMILSAVSVLFLSLQLSGQLFAAWQSAKAQNKSKGWEHIAETAGSCARPRSCSCICSCTDACGWSVAFPFACFPPFIHLLQRTGSTSSQYPSGSSTK